MARLILALLLAGCGGTEEHHIQSIPDDACHKDGRVVDACIHAYACAPEQRNCK